MEASLQARDKAGVQDFVLLENFQSLPDFMGNLEKRFQNDLIYTYIGPVLVSMNPYKQLDIYSKEVMKTYKSEDFYELPPHVFALSDAAFRYMHGENRDQCVLISGESGAGKTEASKKILQYIAATSVHEQAVEQVKDRLLNSNPILEAFGNAKTNRNDNSSRFGKYMDIQFNFEGIPVGGHILNYLLEKSRVVRHAGGERNFHSFYQLLASKDERLLADLRLTADPSQYFYLRQGESMEVRAINDHREFVVMQKALDVCGFPAEQQKDLFAILAAVMHLGNVEFSDRDGTTVISNMDAVENIAAVLGCDITVLKEAFLFRTVEANREKVRTPLPLDKAYFARDALAKAIYDRMFSWLVARVNDSLLSDELKQMIQRKEKRNLLGLLDIYGFEIFAQNGFEQFCINYCNERLQQLFIELTLKQEQEEYHREGIEWEQVEYFNNKVICDLIDTKPVGMIAIMDEECLRPGDTSDATFLEKMKKHFGGHAHFTTLETAKEGRKTMGRDEFRLRHYAGDVSYQVEAFLEKNNDLLFRDLKQAMCETKNVVTSSAFTKAELNSLKRPETAATSFKHSLSNLMEILLSKEPSYIRCIKPNDFKRSGVFNKDVIEHQVKYLGLMENLRVRRAGFAYRRRHDVFLQRYKSLCPQTWPKYVGPAKEGVALLVKHIGFQEDDYRLGTSKIFIRLPRVLFETEDKLVTRKHELATMIQAKYKCHKQRKQYLRMKIAVVMIAKHWRRIIARREFEKRKAAVVVIRKFIKGFMLRNEPACEENRKFIKTTRFNYLMRLRDNLPTGVLDKSWNSHPARLVQEADEQLQALCMRNMVLKYVKAITPDRKGQLQQKAVTSQLFSGRKSSYSGRLSERFMDLRPIPSDGLPGFSSIQNLSELQSQVFAANSKLEPPKEVKYACKVVKYDRHGYKARHRVLLLCTDDIYIVGEKKKVKDHLSFDVITGVTTSAFSDNIFILRTASKDNGSKGDLILECENVYETATKIAMAMKQTQPGQLVQIAEGEARHTKKEGEGIIKFNVGPVPKAFKGEHGQFMVIAVS